MGCSCKKFFKQEDGEVSFEQVYGFNDPYKNYNKNNNKYIEPSFTKKSKTFSGTRDEDTFRQINISIERENSKITNINRQIDINQIKEEELNNLKLIHNSFNDSIPVEIRPLTKCENKTLYLGEWAKNSDIRHGRGILLYPDGSKYLGQWKNNYAFGKGKLIHSNGDIYEGEWNMDKPNGFGEYTRKDGSKYIGQWKDDKQEGKGEEIWKNGSKYIGEFKEGKKNGKGIFIWTDGNKYEGNFEDNNMEGKGTYFFNDKRIYKGNWHKNKIEGKGILIWPDGRQYEGEFKDGKKDGFGLFTTTDGKKYRGEWKDDKQNGEGEIYIPKEDLWKKGIWTNGKRIKWIHEK